ncbi:MAG: tryptophan synthase subunit alpha [bacterium]
MKSIGDTFRHCRQFGRKALMPFLTAGYPDRRSFVKLFRAFNESGADLIEVGIPFSDPMADGKTIQFSSQKALVNGVTVENTLACLSQLGESFDTPLIIMSYYNPIYSYGFKRFLQRARQAGVRGLIIPDLIPEEGTDVERLCRRYRIDLIYLLAPTTDARRRRMVVRRSQGFVYLVSVTGVTGARKSLPVYLNKWIGDVKTECCLPVCVGFGIADLKQALAVARHADGVIMGSAIIDIVRRAQDPRQAVTRVRTFLKQLRKGLDYDLR